MPDELPAKVTLGHLARAERICARRLRLEHANTRANFSANGRFRVANRVTEEVRLAHAELTAPAIERFAGVTADLTPEQRRVYDLATGWYVTLFERPVRIVDEDPWGTDLPGDLRLVGQGGLAFTDADGGAEIRLLRFGARTGIAAPLAAAPDVRFALLRREPWARGRVVRVAAADLVHGTYTDDVLDAASVLPEAAAWLADRLGAIGARVADGRAQPGLECAWCPYIAGCPPMTGRDAP